MQFNTSEAERNLSFLIQVALEGEEVIITRNNQPVVRLQALSYSTSKRQLGSLHGLVKLVSADFDDPLDDFQTYIK
jgi:antitoxin (DNA-binding transcriptional repressor) of toxin-antitoxin stability system